MGNRLIFTDNRLRKLQIREGKKRELFYDDKQTGLALQLTASGRKTFQFRHWDKRLGRTVVVTLGKYPDCSLQEARKMAAGKLVDLNNGIDVTDEIAAIRREVTLDELFELWLEHHAKPHKRSWPEDRRRYNLYFRKPFGKKKLSWFSPVKVRQWHHKITTRQKQKGPKGETISPTTANRALALLSTIFNQAAPDLPNPCRGVKKFREISRDRWLTPDELQRFWKALDDLQTNDLLRDYVLLSLFTGARRSNVLAMKWPDIDLAAKTWTIPADESKNADPMAIPLVGQAMEILTRRKKTADSIFVLPSKKSKTGHYVTPTKAWSSLLKRAGLVGVRLHDLRRTMGSYMAADGASLHLIGKALGHKHQATTQIYARLKLDPVRTAMERAASAMESARTLEEKVAQIDGK